MITVTLQEAKAKLNQLVEAAQQGEDVILMRGSEIIAALRPISAEDLEIAPELTDTQAEHFWSELDLKGKKTFRSGEQAVAFLKRRRT